MLFELPDLAYPFGSLDPYIDTQTMEIHHGKHHAGYVEKLNNELIGLDLKLNSIDDLLGSIDKLPEDKRQSVINNGGGHANHSLFWTIMSPNPKTEPTGRLKDAIEAEFGSLDSFKEKFTTKALGVFGSGWVFLLKKDGKLIIKRHSFQNSPLMYKSKPLMGLDVWEHAYYLKYQNRRADYIAAWWNVLDWTAVELNFD